jgi:cardiolipin synthase
MFLFSIAAARRSICLENAYFVPDDLTARTLVEASGRGVRVEILVPGPRIDKQFVRDASRSRWGPLLQAGARFFEFQPTMLHCKLLIVDGAWVSVGSANFDNRSFRLNDEANLNVLDENFGQEQMAVFDADKRRSREITYAEWQGRSRVQKLVDAGAALLRSQM